MDHEVFQKSLFLLYLMRQTKSVTSVINNANVKNLLKNFFVFSKIFNIFIKIFSRNWFSIFYLRQLEASSFLDINIVRKTRMPIIVFSLFIVFKLNDYFCGM